MDTVKNICYKSMDIKSINNSFINVFIPNCLFYNASPDYNMSIDWADPMVGTWQPPTHSVIQQQLQSISEISQSEAAALLQPTIQLLYIYP